MLPYLKRAFPVALALGCMFFVSCQREKQADISGLGSDGKDDLEIGGEIDSDDERFPRIVEKAGTDLAAIRRELDKIGSRSDDFSLVRIQFG